jgi:hypothetical protein
LVTLRRLKKPLPSRIAALLANCKRAEAGHIVALQKLAL